MKWPDKCDSEAFDKACEEYDMADLEVIDNHFNPVEVKKIYISNLRRSRETAKVLFSSHDIIELEGIQEVPLRSFAEFNGTLPTWIWNVMGRIQWYFNIDRQPEGRNVTIKRADMVIDELEQQNMDCALVTHGFFMKTFINRLKKRGYNIYGQQIFGFKNLKAVIAEKEL